MRPGWRSRRLTVSSELRPGPRRPAGILAIRAVHTLLSVFFLSCLGYVYYAGIARKRGRLLWGAIAALVLEGAVVSANGGDCPLGPVHRRFGDEKTFFELFVPKPVAKRAVPFFAVVTVVGFVMVVLRPPSD
jgi:hypothetical protein